MPIQSNVMPTRDVAAIRRLIDQAMVENIASGVVFDVTPDAQFARVRSGSNSLVTARIAAGGVVKPGDTVIMVRLPQENYRWIILTAYTPNTSGGALTPAITAPSSELAPPGSFEVTGHSGFILASWQSPPQRPDITFEIAVAEVGDELNAVTYFVSGSHFILVLEPGQTRTLRARSIARDWTRSGWTEWAEGTSLAAGTGGGATDHGALTGLSDDDHPQYLNEARGDLRYATASHDHDARYYREDEHIAAGAGASDAGKPIILNPLGKVDSSMLPAAQSGVEKLEDLDDVDLSVVPQDGQALVYDSDLEVWKAGTVSGGGSGVWNPDLPPASPSEYDDEFDGAALGAAWRIYDPRAPESPAIAPSVSDGQLVIETTHWLHSEGLHQYLFGVGRDAPPGSFSAVCKVRVTQIPDDPPFDDMLAIGIGASFNSTAETFRSLAWSQAGGCQVYWKEYGLDTVGSSPSEGYGSLYEDQQPWLYFRFRWNAETRTAQIDNSPDGVNWDSTPALEIAEHEGPPSVIAVSLSGDVGGEAVCEFFRIYPGVGLATDPIYGDYDSAPLSAAQISYTPADDANWDAPDPATVQAALDALATRTGGGGTSDHGSLTGLLDDDHPQYLNETRGDVRYATIGHDHDTDYATIGHNHDSHYYREDEHIVASAGEADAGKPVVLNGDGKLDATMLPLGQGGGAEYFTDLLDVPQTYNGAAGKVVAVNEAGDGLEFVDAPEGGAGGGSVSSQALFTFEGELAPGASPLRIHNATSASKRINKVFLSASEAPATDVVVDVLKDGISIFSAPEDRPKIAANEMTGEAVLVAPVLWASGEYLTAEIVSSTSGANLVVHVVADDSAASNGNAIHSDVEGEIAALTEKTAPVATDLLIIEDSEASNAKKKVQIGSLPGGVSGAYYLRLISGEADQTEGVSRSRATSGKFTKQTAVFAVLAPMLVSKIYWDLGVAATYTLTSQGKTLGSKAIAARELNSEFALNEPLLLIPGAYHFVMTASASVNWDDLVAGNWAGTYLSSGGCYYDTAWYDPYIAPMKLTFKLMEWVST